MLTYITFGDMITGKKRKRVSDFEEKEPPTKKIKVDNYIVCPISKKIYYDPVSADDGYVYERTSLEKWLDEKGTSPATGERMSQKVHSSLPTKIMVNDFIKCNPKYKNMQYVQDLTYNVNYKIIMRFLENKRFHKLLEYVDYCIMNKCYSIPGSIPIIQHLCIHCKDDNIIKHVLDHCLDIEVPDKISGYMPIHNVCRYGSDSIIKYMINKCSNLECKTYFKLRPIHMICQYSTASNVKCLIDKGVNLDCADMYGITPILIACKYGDYAMIRHLNNAGVNVCTHDNNKNTVVNISLQYQDKNTIIYILAEYYRKMLTFTISNDDIVAEDEIVSELDELDEFNELLNEYEYNEFCEELELDFFDELPGLDENNTTNDEIKVEDEDDVEDTPTIELFDDALKNCTDYIKYITQNSKLTNEQDKHNVLLIVLTLENKYNNKTLTNYELDNLIRDGKI